MKEILEIIELNKITNYLDKINELSIKLRVIIRFEFWC